MTKVEAIANNTTDDDVRELCTKLLNTYKQNENQKLNFINALTLSRKI